MGSLSARRTPENSTPQHYAIVMVHGGRWQFPEDVNGKAQGDPDTLMPRASLEPKYQRKKWQPFLFG